jgi:hypothetical protein
MARFAAYTTAVLLLSSSPLLAGPNNQCYAPPAQYTFDSIDKLPAPVVTALKKRFPNLQPTMASCPQVGPSSDADREKPCFVKAGAYGSRWVVAVATRGISGVRGAAVISYMSGEKEAQVVGPGEDTLIPSCALYNFAGIRPAVKSKFRQKPPVAARQTSPRPVAPARSGG